MDRKEPGENRAIDPRPLKEKALERAINDILTAKDRDEANDRYKKWEVFHKEPEFLKAVRQKQIRFKS
jgi:hypothetical protein